MERNDTKPSDGAEAGSPQPPHAEGDKPTGQAGTGQSGSKDRKPAPDDTGN
jgi:hypothetical protein